MKKHFRDWLHFHARLFRRTRNILGRAIKIFSRIDGGEWASAFAFNAFFSLFPIIILSVTIASAFIDREWAGKVIIAHLESYIPISGAMRDYVFNTISGVMQVREQAGAIALLILIWVAIQSFTTLLSASNRAWGIARYNLWQLTLKSLQLLCTTAAAVLIGSALSLLTRMSRHWLPVRHWGQPLGIIFIPFLVVFLGVALFYKQAPREPKRFGEVWSSALFATVLLHITAGLFVIYLKNFATFNVVYGAFAGIMALLLWIYLSGCIIIYGTCLCVAQSEASSTQTTDTPIYKTRETPSKTSLLC